MDLHQLKIDIARAQLGTATDLFLKDRDPVSVQVLACGACELLEGVGEVQNAMVLSALLKRLDPTLKPSKVVRLRNQYWNAMKHFYAADKKTVREDIEIISDFSDDANDTVLWEGWHDYQVLTGALPVEAQVLQVWYFAIYEEKLDPKVDRSAYRAMFPNIRADKRIEQKRRLKRACEKYRGDRSLLAARGTEDRPLTNRRPPT